MLTSACSWTAETTITESRSAGGASYPHPPILDETISYRLNPAPLRATTTSPDEPRFLLLAPGSENARVTDHARNTLRTPPPGGTIFSFQVSPGNSHALLGFGDAKYTIASAASLEDLVTLPDTPPDHDDATGIS